jgi:hypothetical protein
MVSQIHTVYNVYHRSYIYTVYNIYIPYVIFIKLVRRILYIHTVYDTHNIYIPCIIYITHIYLASGHHITATGGHIHTLVGVIFARHLEFDDFVSTGAYN